MFNCLCDNTVQKTAVKKKYIVGSGCKSFEKRFRSIEIRIRKTGPRTVICFKEFYTAPQIYKKNIFLTVCDTGYWRAVHSECGSRMQKIRIRIWKCFSTCQVPPYLCLLCTTTVMVKLIKFFHVCFTSGGVLCL